MGLREDLLRSRMDLGERWIRELLESTQRLSTLPGRVLLGEGPTAQAGREMQVGPSPKLGMGPAITGGEKFAEILAPGLVDVAVTGPAGAISGVASAGRGGLALFNAIVGGVMGAGLSEEGAMGRNVLLGTALGGAAGALGGTARKAAGFERQFTESARPAARQAAREAREGLGQRVASIVRERNRPIEQPFRELGEPIALPGGLHEDVLEKNLLEAYAARPREKDFATLRGLLDAGGEALPGPRGSEANRIQRALQDNIIRSMPPDVRALRARRWMEIAPILEKKAKDLEAPGILEGVRQEVNNMVATAKDYALRTQAQRDEVYTGLAEAFVASTKSEVLQKTELTQLREVLNRLDGETVGSFRTSMLMLPEASRSRFATLLNGLRCASPCVPIVDILEKQPGSWAQVVRELRQAAMLSSPNTWLRNIFSTIGRVAINPARSAAAGVLDIGRAAVLGVPRERYAGEALAELAGLWNGIKAGIGRRAVQSNMPEDLIDFGLKTRAIREFGTRQESALVQKFGQGAAGWGKLSQAPFNALNWQDEMMFTMTYSGEMYRNAYRTALKQGKRGKAAFDEVGKILNQQAHTLKDLHKEAFATAQAAFLKREAKIAAGTAKHPLALDKLALQEWRNLVEQTAPDANRAREMAERAIFIAREGKKLDQLVDGLDGLDQKLGGLVSIALPFRRTPANVMRETIRTSPAGLVGPLYDYGKLVFAARKAGKSAAEAFKIAGSGPQAGEMLDRLGQATIGTAAMYGLLGMADVGLIEVEPYGREKGRADRLTKEAAGIGQDSLRVGNFSIPLDRLEPLGSIVLAAARAKELANNGDLEGAGAVAEAATWELVRRSYDSAFMESLQQFIEAATSEDKVANRFFQRLGGSFAPTTIRDIRRAFNPELTEVEPLEGKPIPRNLIAETARGFAGAFGVGDRPKLGIFGKERKAGLVMGIRGEANPIAQELVSIGAPLDIPKLPDNIPSDAIDSNERDAFIKSKGQMQEFALKRLMSSGNWANLPNETKQRLVRSTVNKINRRINSRATALHNRGRKLTMRDLLRGFIQTGA